MAPAFEHPADAYGPDENQQRVGHALAHREPHCHGDEVGGRCDQQGVLDECVRPCGFCGRWCVAREPARIEMLRLRRSARG